MDIPSYLMGSIAGAKSASGLKYVVVDSLPETGENNIIYLVPKSSSGTNNYYDEYMWINNDWERIGDTEIDLSDYQHLFQYTVVPNATADNVGKIIQYTGTTDSTYTNGYFYQCVSDGENPATYSWENINTQASDEPKYITDENGNKLYFARYDRNMTTAQTNNLNKIAQMLIDDYQREYPGNTNNNNRGHSLIIVNGIDDYSDHCDILYISKRNKYSDSYQYTLTHWNGAAKLISRNQQASITNFNGNYTNGYINTNLEKQVTYFTTNMGVAFNINVLEPDVNYSTPYIPQYNGSPATKKYVDDSIASAIGTALQGNY